MNRHMATVRSHNQRPKPSHAGPKKALTKQQRAAGSSAIHNRGIAASRGEERIGSGVDSASSVSRQQKSTPREARYPKKHPYRNYETPGFARKKPTSTSVAESGSWWVGVDRDTFQARVQQRFPTPTPAQPFSIAMSPGGRLDA